MASQGVRGSARGGLEACKGALRASQGEYRCTYRRKISFLLVYLPKKIVSFRIPPILS